MLNIYHTDVSLPVVFEPQYADTDVQNRMYKIDSSEAIVQWLNSIGLEIVRAGAQLFYTPPHGSIPIHVDGTFLDNKVKLNFQYGGAGSEMRWYQRTAPTATNSATSGQSGKYLMVSEHQATQVWSAKIGKPSLINAGILHNVINGPEPRWVISIPLWDVNANQNLQWTNAITKFEPWLLEKPITDIETISV